MGYDGSRSSVTIGESRVYGVGEFGNVYAVNRKTGKLDWLIDLQKDYDIEPFQFGFATSPLLYKVSLIITPRSSKTCVIAVSPLTGKLLWQSIPVEIGNFSTPRLLRLCGQDVIIVPTSATLAAFDPTSGKLLWRFDQYVSKRAIAMVTPIGNDTVFVTSGYETSSYLLKITKNEKDWHLKTVFHKKEGSQIHPVLFHKGHFMGT